MKSSSCTSSVFIRIPLRVVPPLRRGGRGGIPGVTTAWSAVPGRLSSAELSHRPNVLVMPFHPPCPPFASYCSEIRLCPIRNAGRDLGSANSAFHIV